MRPLLLQQKGIWTVSSFDMDCGTIGNKTLATQNNPPQSPLPHLHSSRKTLQRSVYIGDFKLDSTKQFGGEVISLKMVRHALMVEHTLTVAFCNTCRTLI